ncbi:D-tagatose-bisphosphate aldolase, class II, non-catalytic subunit [Mesorhizobium tamadayense]|uniref:D-tagatose-bisphosphate aldolase, class II, non-catalytic subunit n=1 Tax=Mesorhizobium tamadayense TaxID=425306 RepID=A0A3P3FQ63_9HYPH|nr:D-tagatose-bisphosphate aldolase, class II, non-catalytic subunit [Mesorhizobium tamadayense]RRI00730.1 D-tagatose-bisphosphate aldolase, class II, non-catalytic subunit [Mesorhizobium tamadayense]
MRVTIEDLPLLHRQGKKLGVTSVCSAHPLVLKAALRHGRDTGTTVLIEATCNQVNHLGGYTGMTPSDFAAMVETLAVTEQCPKDLIVLGGDHLGPNPWKDRDAEEAMGQAQAMVDAYVRAGFRKIHLDASMGCKGEPIALDDHTIAERAARLAGVAERAAAESGGASPIYIIGTEVPPPGGANHALDAITPTGPVAARQTHAIHAKAFQSAGIEDAFSRAIGLVVQPGVEFGNQNVIFYDRVKAHALAATLSELPPLIFEAHSTDYQGQGPLRELVEDGFAILKVGPELTFKLREALYALDLIASDMVPDYGERPLYHAMEELMCGAAKNWQSHYHGSDDEKRVLRHYSYSDRIRYYWASAQARTACDRLFKMLKGRKVPATLFHQHMPSAAAWADLDCDGEEIVIGRVRQSIETYERACGT